MSIADRERDWVIIGAGGHGRVVLDALRSGGAVGRLALADPALGPGDAAAWGVDAVVGDDALATLAGDGYGRFVIGVGHTGRPAVRRRLAEAAEAAGLRPGAAVHARAIVAPTAAVAGGTLVAAGAVVNPATRLGAHAIVNTGAIVEHDAVIADHAHVAPGAIVLGGARVGAGAFVGAGAVVLPGVRLGDGVLVAAGVVVTADQPDGARLRRSEPSTTER